MEFIIQPLEAGFDLMDLTEGPTNSVEQCGCVHNTVPQCGCNIGCTKGTSSQGPSSQ
jgi:hypothetical protein